ncbi:LOW QUALITY PROTEIN: uncharacterized protein LOC115579319 [Xyrichtys novacula]|uniref:LOW QUALITY PROTEIN: uncharacterized protein LOC115579319 n=1 Tax=Xyrichtys novacula TaxID=13765 RepID=A0AAV1HFC2_XYRNO|nr:LOW QUALITY PROTEIN: uncharacterized protein LOC115579319 [Xyrichtys novacula]
MSKHSLRRKDLPSVSLLQKSFSSPVTCHASGFYPDRALMFWRKDGEELHEEVDLGEILPNHDGSFQMSVDLNITSVEPEAWGRFECVFQLHGVKEDIITKLDKEVIRTNWGISAPVKPKPEGPEWVSLVGYVVSALILVLVCAVCGFTFYKRTTRRLSPETTQRSATPKHSLRYFMTGSSGVENFPEFNVAVVVDDVMVVACHTKLYVKQDWMNEVFKNDPKQLMIYTDSCAENERNDFKQILHGLKEHFNQSEGVHILQRVSGCDWDDETGESIGFDKFGYNGEDFISLDLETMKWVTTKTQARITEQKWNEETWRANRGKHYLTEVLPTWLKMYVNYGKRSLMRRDLPSVSLLQKSPSSPVTCHASGFYPGKALMFWRKGDVELDEEVDHGEILPNHDGSFQMSADLNIASVEPEDWERYECVFQLHGVKEDIVTKLDKEVIRTNDKTRSDMTLLIVSVVVSVCVLLLLLLLLIAAAALKKKRAHCHQSSPEKNSSELSERLKPDT